MLPVALHLLTQALTYSTSRVAQLRLVSKTEATGNGERGG
jgi:hypothetical protein